jgi:ribosomal protein S18 acetylase RimI-like enzyme
VDCAWIVQEGTSFEDRLSIKIEKMNNQMIFVRIATLNDIRYALEITRETEASALARGTGIAKRSPESVAVKMREGKAVIAVTSAGEWVGFAYLEVYEQGDFISNSGLIVAPKFRNTGVARAIKDKTFKLSRRMFPNSRIFSITSGTAVMKLNTHLGFQPVAFSEITHDEKFWAGCKGCVNYDILERKHKCNCLCTAMLFDPATAIPQYEIPGNSPVLTYLSKSI